MAKHLNQFHLEIYLTSLLIYLKELDEDEVLFLSHKQLLQKLYKKIFKREFESLIECLKENE